MILVPVPIILHTLLVTIVSKLPVPKDDGLRNLIANPQCFLFRFSSLIL